MDPSHIQDVTIRAAVITVSTSRNEKSDSSGEMIKSLLADSGIKISFYRVISDDIEVIRRTFLTVLEDCNCIIIDGGTGITHDDCTIEAIKPLLDKEMDGFGEIFRIKSLEDVGTRAVLSRAIAGITGGKVVFCIPGSLPAVTLAMKEIILPEIRHILTHASR